jgi:predicted transcriptional regulator
MKTHHGMRPQDIVILLKIITSTKKDWQYRDLSADLHISISEISASLHRSHIAGLIDESKRRVHRQSLMEFIEHGLHYVFPQVPGTLVTGLATAHAHECFKHQIESDVVYVWPDDNGNVRGLSITPLHQAVSSAARKDDRLYKLLACIDVIRIGRVREKKIALTALKKEILE